MGFHETRAICMQPAWDFHDPSAHQRSSTIATDELLT